MNRDLEIIAHIDIPFAVFGHRFYKEAFAIARNTQRKVKRKETREKVIGTANTKQVELYGWARNVEAHSDDSGLIYFVALNDGDSIVVTTGHRETVIDLPAGAVVRMDDYCRHFTFDDRPRVCAFIGSYPTCHDYDAIMALQHGVELLAKGEYYGAPRVREGFRVVLPDECYVSADIDTLELMLLKDAKEQGKFIQECAVCGRPAAKIDHQWPWFMDLHRCMEHIGVES